MVVRRQCSVVPFQAILLLITCAARLSKQRNAILRMLWTIVNVCLLVLNTPYFVQSQCLEAQAGKRVAAGPMMADLLPVMRTTPVTIKLLSQTNLEITTTVAKLLLEEAMQYSVVVSSFAPSKRCVRHLINSRSCIFVSRFKLHRVRRPCKWKI